MRLVVIESPYGRNVDGSHADAATIERNVRYLRACMADCLSRGEAPIASHGLYTQPGVLDDTKPEERKKGMLAGWAWHSVANAIVVYQDLGVTQGMRAGIEHADSLVNDEKIAVAPTIERRSLGGEWSVNERDRISAGWGSQLDAIGTLEKQLAKLHTIATAHNPRPPSPEHRARFEAHQRELDADPVKAERAWNNVMKALDARELMSLSERTKCEALWDAWDAEREPQAKTILLLRLGETVAQWMTHAEALERAIGKANDALFDACGEDIEHQIRCHEDSLPKTLRMVAKGAQKALDVLQVVIQEMGGGD